MNSGFESLNITVIKLRFPWSTFVASHVIRGLHGRLSSQMFSVCHALHFFLLPSPHTCNWSDQRRAFKRHDYYSSPFLFEPIGHCFCSVVEMILYTVFVYPQPRLTPKEWNSVPESCAIFIQCAFK